MSIPFALSLGKYVSSTATDVGFASLLGVALLALLYFAGARETRTLRDQLDEAHSKLTSLEGRLSQSLRNQAARAQAGQQTQVPSVPGRPGVVPAPAVGAMGSAVARVQREAAAAAGVPGALIGAAMASAAPSLGSATKLIPSPVAAPAAMPLPAAVPAAATVAGTAYAEEDEEEYEEEYAAENTLFVPAGRTAAANGQGGGGAAVAAPPRVQLYDDQAQDSGPVPRRTIPTVDTGPSRTRVFAGRLGGSLAAVVVVAVIVVVLLLITSSGGTKHKAPLASKTTTTVKKKKPPVFQPSTVKVSVLNGTSTSGLAADVGAKLTGDGYKVPQAAVTNDGSEQQATSTTVSYRPGYGNAAVHIAKALAQAYSIAQPLTQVASATDITNCGTPVTTGVTGTCPANVIVTVGGDLAGIADSGNSGG